MHVVILCATLDSVNVSRVFWLVFCSSAKFAHYMRHQLLSVRENLQATSYVQESRASGSVE